MKPDQRLSSFLHLSEELRALAEHDPQHIKQKAQAINPWFTAYNINFALTSIADMLDKKKLQEWLDKYDCNNKETKNVGLVTAGNIPLVGFHDILCILLSGHRLVIKISSSDNTLTEYLLNKLMEIDPGWKSRISIVDKLKDYDAVIATGSDNTSRYFQYYFRNAPHIIRKNRTSIAVLDGTESEEELKKLGKDVFTYFGLGCRNVSKIYFPETFDATKILDAWQSYAYLVDHHKYHNNYVYNRTIYLMKAINFLDAGFIMLKEDDAIISPISVVYTEKYNDLAQVQSWLTNHKEKVQCVVGPSSFPHAVPFGKAQEPTLSDYADGVDTMQFLCSLS